MFFLLPRSSTVGSWPPYTKHQETWHSGNGGTVAVVVMKALNEYNRVTETRKISSQQCQANVRLFLEQITHVGIFFLPFPPLSHTGSLSVNLPGDGGLWPTTLHCSSAWELSSSRNAETGAGKRDTWPSYGKKFSVEIKNQEFSWIHVIYKQSWKTKWTRILLNIFIFSFLVNAVKQCYCFLSVWSSAETLNT